jgi:predicted RNA-binding protein with PIN domain
MHYLIDGYNLLHAMGIIRGRPGPTGLEKARLRLLGLLGGTYGEEAGQVTIVFDAAGALPGATEFKDYKGLQVRFAGRRQEADDLIEFLIEHDSAPKKLHVISDDHRIQQAARRRQCIVLGCADYVDWLDRHRRERRQPPPQAGGKPERVSEAESQRWLREFAHLEEDPDLKELFEMDRFEDDGPVSPRRASGARDECEPINHVVSANR